MDLPELGRNIAYIRHLRGKTQEEFAFELDMSTTAYARIERGETNVAFLRLQQISKGLQVNLWDLVHPFFTHRHGYPTVTADSPVNLDNILAADQH